MANIIVMSQIELCELLRVSRPTIVKYTGNGMPVISRGKYNASDVVNWYCEFKKKAALEASYTGNQAKSSEERLIEARAIKIETDNAERDRTLLNVEEVEALLASVATTIANSLEALPPRLAPILATMEEPAEIQAEIRKEARTTRKVVADKIRAMGLEAEDVEY